jgi:23S rRNA U2552 (ribose-2'-O)-methylase RlmE/FtsJ
MNKMMKNIAREMQRATKAFTPELQTAPKHILDLCMAPGTYLAEALKHCPTAHAVAFTLPPEQGGLVPIMTESETVKIHKLDITMLAADMGLSPGEIDPSHPDAANFIHSRYLDDGRAFDLAICDGATRRTHERAAYRFYREGRRLLLTQLVLGLEHLRPGGSMIVLLHKLERPTTIRLLRVFHGFASAVLFKPKSGHATRSSFYMIASNVRSSDREAVEAVQEWKRDWKVSTVGTDEEWREDHARVAGFGELGIQGVLEEFGPTLVKLGQRVWKTQADGLKGASFMKK